MFSSGIDFTPTLLNILNINVQNSLKAIPFFDDQKNIRIILACMSSNLYIIIKRTGRKKNDQPRGADQHQLRGRAITKRPEYTAYAVRIFGLFTGKEMFEQGENVVVFISMICFMVK